MRATRQRGRHSDAVVIRTGAITLAAFLKWARLADSGGQAKWVIQSGRVAVNGVVERRRGRRLVPGDRVVVDGRAYQVVTGLPEDAPRGVRES